MRAPSRRLPFAAVALVVAVALASCGTLRSAARTRRALRDEGFRAAGVSARETNGITTVAVQLHSSTSPVAEDRAADIVWRTFDYRVDRIQVDSTNGSRVYPRFALQQEFGPRPAGFDRRTVGSDFARTGRRVAIAVGIAGILALVVVAIAIALIVHFVRRGRGPPPLAPPAPGQPFNPSVHGTGGTGWQPPPGGG